MNLKKYTAKFKEAAGLLDTKLLEAKQLEVAVGVYEDSVFLKLYKKSWANPPDPVTAASRIFFSVWITDLGLQQRKVYYNIHALKLRQLKGYAIESRKFADAFRSDFKAFESKWPNVATKFGPLTLMQGWYRVDPENFGEEILELAYLFLGIEHLVDNTLARFKR